MKILWHGLVIFGLRGESGVFYGFGFFLFEIAKSDFSVRHAGPRDFPRRRGRVAGHGLGGLLKRLLFFYVRDVGLV